MSFYYDPKHGKVELWPLPKVGDCFSIELEVRESWLRRQLRKIGWIRTPKKLERRILRVTQEAVSGEQFPSGEYQGWR